MAAVKWVKITVDMFDNRKIKHLRKLPDGNSVVLIWVMLLTMAGRCNAGGMVFLTENIPYTPKMLADELGFEENTVKMALQALENFNMIQTNEGFFTIPGWEEYQNVEGLDRIREQNRLRKAAERARKKALSLPENTACDGHVTVTQGHATDKEEDIKKKKEELEGICDSSSGSPTPPPKPAKAVKHKYGEYQNVLLTDDEMDKLKEIFYDWQERIDRLSGYIASTGKKYKSHYATIRNWAKKDEQAQPVTRTQAQQPYKKPSKAEEMNDFYNMAANWANGSEGNG